MNAVGTLLQILRIAVPAGYLLVALGYLFMFVKQKEARIPWVRPVYFSAVALHTLLLILLFAEQGAFPFGTVARGIAFCSWVLAILYLAIEKVLEDFSYGAFFLPVQAFIAALSLAFLNRGEPLPAPMVSYYFILHVTLLFTAYACFLFSFIVSAMYLLQHAGLKTRKPGLFFSRLPSLDSMDQTIRLLDGLGLSLIVLGIITGFLWLDAFNMSLASNIPVKAGFILLTFAVYLSEHLLRMGKGWKGQRACIISILGFLLVLCTLYLGRHGY